MCSESNQADYNELTVNKEPIHNNITDTKINEIMDLLANKFEQLATEYTITICDLLGDEVKKYDNSQLTNISIVFFNKYENHIEFISNSNERIGLIYNLPFTKKNMK